MQTIISIWCVICFVDQTFVEANEDWHRERIQKMKEIDLGFGQNANLIKEIYPLQGMVLMLA
jgi:hypothetical protein